MGGKKQLITVGAFKVKPDTITGEKMKNNICI